MIIISAIVVILTVITATHQHSQHHQSSPSTPPPPSPSPPLCCRIPGWPGWKNSWRLPSPVLLISQTEKQTRDQPKVKQLVNGTAGTSTQVPGSLLQCSWHQPCVNSLSNKYPSQQAFLGRGRRFDDFFSLFQGSQLFHVFVSSFHSQSSTYCFQTLSRYQKQGCFLYFLSGENIFLVKQRKRRQTRGHFSW